MKTGPLVLEPLGGRRGQESAQIDAWQQKITRRRGVGKGVDEHAHKHHGARLQGRGIQGGQAQGLDQVALHLAARECAQSCNAHIPALPRHPAPGEVHTTPNANARQETH